MVIRANYHTHTTFCDGTDTAEDMVKAAIALGFEHLGFSGHIDSYARVDKKKYYAELNCLEQIYGDKIEILRGIELDNTENPNEADEAEYVIGSTHYLNMPPIDGEMLSVDGSVENVHRLAETYFSGDYYALSRAYYEFEAQVYDRLHPTFIGHFDLVTRFNDLSPEMGGHFLDENDPRYLTPALDAIEHLVRCGVPFEINCGAVNRGRKHFPYPAPPLMRALHSFGAEILISADAHQKEKLNGGFDAALELAREVGFDHVNILTRDSSGYDKRPAGRGLYWQEIAI